MNNCKNLEEQRDQVVLGQIRGRRSDAHRRHDAHRRLDVHRRHDSHESL